MMLTFMMQWGIRQSAEVSNQLTAVERILEYTQLPAEKVFCACAYIISIHSMNNKCFTFSGYYKAAID